MQHQFHYGKKFYLDSKTGYWISTQTPKIRAHVFVWKYNHGYIPKKHHIHHIDENKSNNSIENLKMLSTKQHNDLHSTDERRNKSRIRMQLIVRPKADKWHGSEEGIKWHKKHAIEMGFGKPKPIESKCITCQKTYISYKHNGIKFCCNNCKSEYRRNLGVDDIDVPCKICSKIFRKNKYAIKKNCSRRCADISRANKINTKA